MEAKLDKLVDKSDSISIEKMNVIQTLIWINKVAFPIPILIILLYV